MKNITAKQQEMINQVAATMAIEEMYLTETNKKELEDILTGKTAIDESIEKTKRRYSYDESCTNQ